MRRWLIRKLIGRDLKAWVIWRSLLVERQAINPKDRRPQLSRAGSIWICRTDRGCDTGGYGETPKEAYADWKFHSPYAPLDSDMRVDEWNGDRKICD
jgi:hypothetical protein